MRLSQDVSLKEVLKVGQFVYMVRALHGYLGSADKTEIKKMRVTKVDTDRIETADLDRGYTGHFDRLYLRTNGALSLSEAKALIPAIKRAMAKETLRRAKRDLVYLKKNLKMTQKAIVMAQRALK